jgi:hypothetical protein
MLRFFEKEVTCGSLIGLPAISLLNRSGQVCRFLCRLKSLIEFKCANVPAFGKASYENSDY